jgi:crotonobetainyl-CoA:carnitine CoA-transferase CaiB-like acyl-CoA transferase
MVEHPGAAAAGLVTTALSPAYGLVQTPGVGHRLSRTPAMSGVAPVRGSDGVAILGELGYTDDDIQGLFTRQVVKPAAG